MWGRTNTWPGGSQVLVSLHSLLAVRCCVAQRAVRQHVANSEGGQSGLRMAQPHKSVAVRLVSMATSRIYFADLSPDLHRHRAQAAYQFAPLRLPGCGRSLLVRAADH